MTVALTNCDVFTGSVIDRRRAVVLDGPLVREVVVLDALPRDVDLVDLGGSLVAPGFIDIQVNGGGGTLFNDDTSVEGIRTIAEAHAACGTLGFLPTLISASTGEMLAAVQAVRDAVAADVPGVLGLHLEGPYLDVAMRGCHEDRVFRQLTDHELESVLLPARDVLRILTVSPKMVSAAQIERLVAAGITVFLGHTEATYEEATAAFSAGARGVTHLFNAMSGMTRGEPGTVGAALAAPGAWAGVIADGVHVHPGSLTAAKRAKGDHLVLVSDAMPPLGVGDSSFRLGPHDIRCIDGRCTTADGTLAGSAVPVVKGVRTYVQRCGIPLEEGLRMASTYPARLLVAAGTGRLGASQIGTIAPGSAADLVILGPDLQVRGTVRRGAVRFRS